MGKMYAVILGAVCGANLACGLYWVHEAGSRRDYIRQAIYAKSEAITPQVIREADNAVKREGLIPLTFSIFTLGTAGMTGAFALRHAVGRED